MKKWFKEYPRYALLPVIITCVYQISFYFLITFIVKNFPTYSLAIPGIDENIPFIPAFIIPYTLSFPFWYITFFIIGTTEKKHFYNFISMCLIGYTIGFIMLMVIHGGIERLELDTSNFFEWCLSFMYMMDNPDMGIKLFPSFHVLVSFYICVGLFRQKNIHISYRIISIIMLVIISLSTVFIKQHYFVDIIAALVLGALTCFISYRFNLGRFVEKIFERKKETK